MDRVCVGQVMRHQSVTGLVVGGDELLLLGEEARFLLRAGDDPQNRFLELLHLDDALAPARGQQSGLVHQIGQVGAGEPRRLCRQHLEVDAGSERFTAGMDGQDGLAALPVRSVNDYLPVEAAGSQKSRVKDIGPVGRRHDNDALVGLEAVHFD